MSTRICVVPIVAFGLTVIVAERETRAEARGLRVTEGRMADGQTTDDVCAAQSGAPRPEARPAAAGPDLGQPPDPVVAAAVALIRKRLPLVPRIYVVNPATLNLRTSSTDTPAFRVWYGDRPNPNIFVNPSSLVYEQARRGDPCALKSLAGLLVHEIEHTLTTDETEPSRIEMTVLDEFLKDPAITLSERTCLIERRKTVRRYGGVR